MNLFDFSSSLPDYSSLSPMAEALKGKTSKAPISGAFGGWISPPTINSSPLPWYRNEGKSWFSIVPEAKASDWKIIQSFLDNPKEKDVNKEVVFKMLKDWVSEDEVEEIIKKNSAYSSEYYITTAPEKSITEGWFYSPGWKEWERGVVGNILDKTSGLGAGFTNVFGNLASLETYLDPTEYLKWGDISAQAEKRKEEVNKMFQLPGDEKLGGYDAGKFIGELTVLSAVPTTAAGTITKNLSKVTPKSVEKFGTYLLEEFPKLAPVAKETVKSFINAIPNAATFQAINEGRVTPETTAFYASFAPVLNIAKSLPLVNKYLGRSEIMNAPAIARWEGLYEKWTEKLIGTVPELRKAAVRVWGPWDREIAKTVEAVKNTDIRWVKTTRDLNAKLSSDVQRLSWERFKVLETEKTLFKPSNSQIEYNFKWAKTKTSPVSDALSDLDKAASAEDKAVIWYLGKKFNSSGLTANEMDDLAKLHSKYNDAFKASWDLNKSKADLESTRKGIKTLIGNTQQWKKALEFDAKMSPAISLRDYTEVAKEAVDVVSANSKIKFWEQLGKLVTNAFDTKTGRWLAKSFWGGGELVESKIGAAGRDKMIKKDLELIKKLSEAVNWAKTAQEALAIIDKFALPESAKIVKPQVTSRIIKKPK